MAPTLPNTPFYYQQWFINLLYFAWIAIVMPVLLQITTGLLIIFIEKYTQYKALFFPVFIWAIGPFILGYWLKYSKNRRPKSKRFIERYGIEVGIIVYSLIICSASIFLLGEDFDGRKLSPVMIGLITYSPTFIATSFGAAYYYNYLVPIVIPTSYLLGVICRTVRLGQFKVVGKSWIPLLFISVALAGCNTYKLKERNDYMITMSDREIEGIVEDSESFRYNYIPFKKGQTNLTPIKGNSQLKIENNFPRLDGATALYPIYASAVQGIYKEPTTDEEREAIWEVVNSTRTPYAYKNLVDNKVDLIFAAAPSAKQIEEAREKGVEFKLTPVAKEAFVFIVNEKNPITALSVEQIRSIYAGDINNWNEVGSTSTAKIFAYQRPDGSGSQSTLVNQVMKDTPLRKPLTEERFQGMGGVIVGVADYRNAENALGYSFRFYATRMKAIDGIRLLAIDGVAPTVENIRNNSYPFASEFYMVTVESVDRPLTENTKKLMNWFLSDQGQQLIEDVGYVSLRDSQ